MKLFILILLLLFSGVLPAAPQLIPIIFDNPILNEQQQLSRETTRANILYKIAFQRLGYHYMTQSYPGRRSAYLAEQAKIDGLVHRAELFADHHPRLIRVKEAIVIARIVAYGIDPELKINHWQALQYRSYHINYWRNIEFIQQKLEETLPETSFEAVNSSASGLRKVMVGRADIFIGIESVVDLVRQQAEFKSIIKLGVIQQLPLYPYLNQHHQKLAAKLAKMLRQVKKEVQ